MPSDLFEWASRKARAYGRMRVRDGMRAEVERLAGEVRRAVPVRTGALKRSVRAVGRQVRALSYSQIVSDGGVIRSRRWMTIPVDGYTPGTGYVTVADRSGGQIIVRRGTFQLWAVRRREVRLRGTHYLERARASFARGVGAKSFPELGDL